MGRNLGPLNIKDSYEGLVQISGSSRDTLTDGSGSVITNLDVTSSFALTASFAENVVPTPTGSFMVTGSVTDATLTFTKGDASTFPLTVNNVANATSATLALSASHAVQADNALTATSASHAVNSDTAISASYAVTASFAENITIPTLQEVTDAGSTTTNNLNTGTIDAGVLISRDGLTVTGSANQIRIIDNFDLAKNINVSWEENNNSLEFDSSGTISGATFIIDETTFTKTQLSNISASGYVSASEFIGDGSGLTNLPGATAFPYTGSAEITGSLSVTGSTSIKGDLTATDNNGQATILGVEGNVGNASEFTITTGGKNGANSATGQNAASIGGQLHTNTGGQSFIGGGRNNDINGAQRAVILAGNDNTLSGGNDDGYGIYNGGGNVINSNGGRNTTILGGAQHTIRNFWSTTDDIANGYPREMYGLIAGGYDNQIGQASGNTGANGLPLIIGGVYNKIGETTVDNTILTKYNTIINSSGSATDSGSFQGVIGGYENYISGSDNAYIIASNNSTIDTHNNSVIIGGSGLTTTQDDEVVVPNLTISGSGAVLTFADGTTQSTAGGGGGAAFPFTGSAEITGSLEVIGSIESTEDVVFNGITVGLGAGQGARNTAVGEGALDATTSAATDNVAIGYEALSGALTGDYNVAVGKHAGRVLAGSAVDNIYIGWAAGYSQTAGNDNVMIGAVTGQAVTNASNNTLVGAQIAVALTTGNNNTIVGPTGAGGGLTTGGNNTILGKATGLTSGLSNNIILADGAGNIAYQYDNATTTTTFSGAVVQNVEALTISANVAELDASLGNLFTLTLQNGVNTEVELINQVAGQTFQLQITNNATSAGTITFDSQFEFVGGTPFTATAATSAVDILTFTCFGGGNVQCIGDKNFS